MTEQVIQADQHGLVRGLRPPKLKGSWLGRHPNTVRFVSVGSFLIAWELYGRSLNPIFLSYPTAIIKAFADLIVSGELLTALLQSMLSLVIGFVIAMVLGIAIGLAMGRYRTAQLVLDPFVTALYNTPNIAVVPLIQLWFGFDTDAKVIIVVLSAIFPIIINTYAGVRDVSQSTVDVVRAFGANDRQILTKVIVPGAVPFIMAGVRLGVGRAVVGVVVAEFFMVLNGLGGLIILFSNTFQTAKLYVPTITLVVLGFLFTEGVRRLEQRFASWKETERAKQG